ncbi:hypothetical protein LSH36_89g05003 [Paralvinella palmiformis]|uniref:Chromatin-remodeling ATPase INO80 n=1 Tax=Paralvinella palmiformis TaxID=53620 RepID=A0AAD9K2M2_9ANNE|nr:hypothetical protein LSH36_89g05003 [Paralvinella palmiformis]
MAAIITWKPNFDWHIAKCLSSPGWLSSGQQLSADGKVKTDVIVFYLTSRRQHCCQLLDVGNRLLYFLSVTRLWWLGRGNCLQTIILSMVLRMAVSHVLLSDDQGLLQLYINTSEYVLSYRFDLGSVSADVASGNKFSTHKKTGALCEQFAFDKYKKGIREDFEIWSPEYMWHRKHTYIRLDGSSKISERRDMVADFQNRSDIFVFLLSTRAGGLGINLTAADTVIFYDSDWNPTVDQQAMDRAHRLGQTKQVTVYRLICKGTIEERILQRAREKSEIQRMVISGGNYRPDVLKPKEVVSLLLDDDEMEKKLRQRQEEKKLKEDGKTKEKKRKPYTYIPGVARPHSGRGPGRPPKRLKMEEAQKNVTIPATELDGNISVDSVSATASPQSVMSVGSEVTQNSTLGDESSNDALVIVDDSSQTSSTPATPSGKRGRPRGRPRGSGVGRRPRGRGSVQKALGAAEAAAAQAAKKAAYEAYGYSFSDNGANPTLKTIPANYRPTRRGRGRGRGSHHAHRPLS